MNWCGAAGPTCRRVSPPGRFRNWSITYSPERSISSRRTYARANTSPVVITANGSCAKR